ncbi:hypothetical protein M0651_12500 [Paenibacillus sp. MBLB2552]|uniref:Uncharacterized protein n=1 Tax=Paenibacillus mellifer TaxID=2937794 RepID=A0A9X1XYY5_9BACL|nr:hypothetical protein [Paenibacillus mellifer]MCK8487994.1 hypothetical protein [Paenibacillus mellifer]
MAENEIYKLDIETDDRDVDRTAKKLRSLDKLLQQTQRRVALLGKTRIKPTLALDDRLMSAARKAEEALTRLHRMTAKPTVQFNDRVSAYALKLRASLAALAAAPWQVTAAGVDWEAVIGDSFAGRVSSEGKSTLKRISSAVGETLGEGLKVKIFEELGLGEVMGNSRQHFGNSGIMKKKEPLSSSLSEIPRFNAYNMLTSRITEIAPKRDSVNSNFAGAPSNGSIYTEAGIKAGEDFFQAFLSTLDSKQIGDKLASTSTSSAKGQTNKKLAKWEEGTLDIFKDVAVSLFSGWLGVKIDKWSGNASKKLIDDLDKAPKKSEIPSASSTKPPGKAPTFWTKWLGESKTKASLASGAAKGVVRSAGPIGLTLLFNDAYNISAALTDFVLGHKAGDRKYRDPVFGFPKDNYTDTVSPFRWREVRDFLRKNDSVVSFSDRIMAPSVQGVTRPESNVNVPKVMGTPVPNYYQLPEEVRSKIGEASYKKPTPPVNVSLSEGTINLTVNKEKLDYQKLAETTGWKIANEVRFAMQNLK